jgi:hypothetical protein
VGIQELLDCNGRQKQSAQPETMVHPHDAREQDNQPNKP